MCHQGAPDDTVGSGSLIPQPTPHLQFEKQRSSYRGTKAQGASFACRAPFTRPSPGPSRSPGRQRNSGPSRGGCEAGDADSCADNRHLHCCNSWQLAESSVCLVLPRARGGSLRSCLGRNSVVEGACPFPSPGPPGASEDPLAVLCLGSPPPPRELPPGSGRVKGLPAPEPGVSQPLSAQHSMKSLVYTQDKCGKVLSPSAQTGHLRQAGRGPAPFR